MAGALQHDPTVVPTDLFAFGNRSRPRPPRPGDLGDILVDSEGMVGPEGRPSPSGASTFADLDRAAIALRGHYHRLSAGTRLPEGLEIIADGRDIDPQSTRMPSHHTIYPASRMRFEIYVGLYLGLPWRYGGRLG